MDLTETEYLLGITTFIIMILILMMVLVYGIFIRKKSDLVLAQQKRNAAYEQELALTQVEIKEQTLDYIGQELHDNLGQKLSVARLMNNKIPAAKAEEKDQIANEINILVGECLQDIRNLSNVFISKQVRRSGFLESLEREIFRIERLDLMKVEYEVNKSDLRLDPNHGLILFRIVQECINNVIKHSRSSNIVIKIEDSRDVTKIHISDSGIGFEVCRNDEGCGLKNMINRAKIINADFKLTSEQGKGTEINITYNKPAAWKESKSQS